MRELQYFIAITVAIGAGFGIGFAAGISEPFRNDLEWETLLAGATAIVGGGMAYAGATQPFRRELRRKLDNHIHEFRSRCDGFLIFTEPGSDLLETFIKDFDPNGLGGDDDIISTLAHSAFEKLPSVPDDIVTPELLLKRGEVHRHLGRFGQQGGQPLLRLPPSIPATRKAIFDYCDLASTRA